MLDFNPLKNSIKGYKGFGWVSLRQIQDSVQTDKANPDAFRESFYSQAKRYQMARVSLQSQVLK